MLGITSKMLTQRLRGLERDRLCAVRYFRWSAQGWMELTKLRLNGLRPRSSHGRSGTRRKSSRA